MSGLEEGAEAGFESAGVAGLAFPDDEDLPAEFLQSFDVSAIANGGRRIFQVGISRWCLY